MYADILARAARNGWNYTPESIDSGSKRHFGEIRLQLIAVGYEIVSVGTHPRCTGLNKLADAQQPTIRPFAAQARDIDVEGAGICGRFRPTVCFSALSGSR